MFFQALLGQILGDFDDVVDSITNSGDSVDSAELEVFDVIENNGYVDFKLIFRFKVPQYKVRDTSGDCLGTNILNRTPTHPCIR